MPFVLIIHDVADYPAWKTVFDGAAVIRKAAGEIRFQVLRDDTTPNRVIHFSQWRSHDDARRFFQSPELVEIRRQAGVSSPEFHYLDEVERGQL
jgi:heme-degrading monooxygenase HmoA